MQIHEMTKEECRTALMRVSVGRLACVHNGEPYVVPMRFSYDGTYLYGFGTLGKKIDCMRSNPFVCAEFDEQKSHFEWMSIVVSGRFEELPDTPDFEAARLHAHAALQKHAMWWQPALAATEHSQPLTLIYYRIHVKHMTGRRGTPEPVEAVTLAGRNTANDQSRGL